MNEEQEQMTKANTPQDEELWGLLEEAKPTKASPVFSQNVLRAARLSSQEKPSVIKSFFSNPAFFAPALAVVGIAAFMTFSPSTNQSEGGIAVITSDDATEESWMDEALLATAIEKPELFSEEEIVAMLF